MNNRLKNLLAVGITVGAIIMVGFTYNEIIENKIQSNHIKEKKINHKLMSGGRTKENIDQNNKSINEEIRLKNLNSNEILLVNKENPLKNSY